jgi:uncharacterized membrane protein
MIFGAFGLFFTALKCIGLRFFACSTALTRIIMYRIPFFEICLMISGAFGLFFTALKCIGLRLSHDFRLV